MGFVVEILCKNNKLCSAGQSGGGKDGKFMVLSRAFEYD